MSSLKQLLSLSGLLAFLVVSAGTPLNVLADHSWNGYHLLWDSSKLSAGRLPLKVNDNTTLSSKWGSGTILESVIKKWNDGWTTCTGISTACPLYSPLILSKGSGHNFSNQRKCSPRLGEVEVCDTTYGKNGWLGIASVWVSGGHITQGTVKLNDTYFNTATYNKPEWKNLVLCQELGHTVGLDHQDENFSNPVLGTCMDYTSTTNSPGSNQYPNYHDFEQLKTIYSHVDTTGTSSSATTSPGRAPPELFDDMNVQSQWGELIRRSRNGRTEVYMRNIGGGHAVFTFVIRAE